MVASQSNYARGTPTPGPRSGPTARRPVCARTQTTRGPGRPRKPQRSCLPRLQPRRGPGSRELARGTAAPLGRSWCRKAPAHQKRRPRPRQHPEGRACSSTARLFQVSSGLPGVPCLLCPVRHCRCRVQGILLHFEAVPGMSLMQPHLRHAVLTLMHLGLQPEG